MVTLKQLINEFEKETTKFNKLKSEMAELDREWDRYDDCGAPNALDKLRPKYHKVRESFSTSQAKINQLKFDIIEKLNEVR